MWMPRLLQILLLCCITSALTLRRDDTNVDSHPERRLKRQDAKSDGHEAQCAGKCEHSGDTSHNFHVSIYHINDVHAHLDEFKSSGATCVDPTQGCIGGYPRIKTIVQQQRPHKKNSLFLNAGDEFQGTLFYKIYKGEKIAVVLNQLGFDAMTLGNHEFDDGDDLLADFLANLTFPIVSSNIHTKNTHLADQLIPFTIFHHYDLALLALTTETTAGISNPSNLTTFEDSITAAQRTVDAIKKHYPHINRIVALTHIGYTEDIRLAQNTKGISLIVGGHSHTLLGNMTGAAGPYPTIAQNLDGEDVYVVTSYKWGEYLGYIDVEFDRRGRIVSYEGAPIRITNATEEEPGLKSQLKTWEQAFQIYADTVIGFTQTDLTRDCQKVECNLGDLTADALEAYRPGPIAAIMNAGGIRISIDAGNITLQEALDCFPFGNAYVELEFTGTQLWDVFESVVSRVSVNNGQPVTSFAQVSKNIRITYNPENENGNKLITLVIAGQPVVLSRTYRIATVDFLAGGGDNLWPPRSDFTVLANVEDVFSQYVGERSPIDYQLDGRISITSEKTPQKGD